MATIESIGQLKRVADASISQLKRIADALEALVKLLQEPQAVNEEVQPATTSAIETPYVSPEFVPITCDAPSVRTPNVRCALLLGHDGAHISRVPRWSWEDHEVLDEEKNDCQR